MAAAFTATPVVHHVTRVPRSHPARRSAYRSCGAGARAAKTSLRRRVSGARSAVRSCASSKSSASTASVRGGDENTLPMDGLVYRDVSPDLRGWKVAGPPAEKGMLPAIIYFALTAEQSLGLDPYNQFARFALGFEHEPQLGELEVLERLQRAELRVFSVTLPFHGTMEQNKLAFKNWAQAYAAGQDILSGFLNRVDRGIQTLLKTQIDPDRLWTAGLSRGGLIASLVAMRNPEVTGVLAFSAVTVPGDLKELREVREQPALKALSLKTPQNLEILSKKETRFYIGNQDETVGTRNCFDVAHGLAAASNARSPPHEFIMYCSLGREGHGTSVDVFQDGATWIRRKILR
ncbi:hypothetical protein FVE85_7999 [Porphyridium purpureum]|uniref:Uncharacterized protein n=1 Tax=Porphyridium purpureum TaxID=35688 RepID=A0A5J4YNF2_PORPP|nr:hypothetical protein FVE85_7999 [Porphyridium purpureum]|eukprot:POR1697..scf295_9